MYYDVIIVGAGPGGIFACWELARNSGLSVAVFESGHELDRRRCPIDGKKVKTCIGCPTCSIMSGFGGAGAFSDGKYNITNDFGGTLYEHIGKERALELMHYVDRINMTHGGEGTALYSTAGTALKKVCMQNRLTLLSASVRHLGTDINYRVLERLYEELKDRADFYFDTPVGEVEVMDPAAEGLPAGEERGGADTDAPRPRFRVVTKKGTFTCRECIVSVGRSGSKWAEQLCRKLSIPTKSNRVDIGVRVEIPAEIFAHITDELYESKIVYRTEKFEDHVRTFCMNPHGIVVNENTNGIITVNGHSFEDPAKKTQNTNFALLVAKHFSEPFKDSNGYGESIARLSNMLGGGVIVQRFGDLERGRRSTVKRIEEGTVRPTLNATPGDLSLVLPKRILDGIIEMIYALDKIAPGTANDDTLLYGVEVKFYNMEVDVDDRLETCYPGLFMIGDGSGVTHSLSHASASGVFVAREILGIR
ncbi:MAG: NAD(P)-binding protein [Lachnospiraceae bacterium]|nr:NAD(P)-binding protein [Lachnospiraceae bacterium]